MGLLFQQCLIQIKTVAGIALAAARPESLRGWLKKETNLNSPHSISVGAVGAGLQPAFGIT
jgi:hypothetical protein